MADLTVDQIRALLEGTTPGPWHGLPHTGTVMGPVAPVASNIALRNRSLIAAAPDLARQLLEALQTIEGMRTRLANLDEPLCASCGEYVYDCSCLTATPQPGTLPREAVVTPLVLLIDHHVHACPTCGPTPSYPGPGCLNCRWTGYDQTPCPNCPGVASKVEPGNEGSDG